MKPQKYTIKALKLIEEGHGGGLVYTILEPQPYSEIIYAPDTEADKIRTANLENWVKDYLYKSAAQKSWIMNTEDEVEDLVSISQNNIFMRPEHVVEEHFTVEISKHPNGDYIWTPLVKGKLIEELWR